MNNSTSFARNLVHSVILSCKNEGIRPVFLRPGKIRSKHLHTATVPVKEIKIPVQWGHISAKLWGDENRRPILALHGWQDNAGTWDPLAPMISNKLPILAIDFPGHGFSSWIPAGLQYYPWDYARLIITLKDYFKWDKISLLCHSMGSIAAMRYACLFPDDVDFYIAVDHIIADDYDLNQVVDRLPKLLKKIQVTQERLYTEPPSYTMEKLIEKWHLGTNKSVSKESVKFLAERGAKQSANDPNKYYFSRDTRLKYTIFNPEDKIFVEKVVRRLKCPTLYFKAIDSPYASDEYSVDLREIVEKNNPNFEGHFVPGTHHVHLNNPDALAPIIMKFLQKHNFIE